MNLIRHSETVRSINVCFSLANEEVVSLDISFVSMFARYLSIYNKVFNRYMPHIYHKSHTIKVQYFGGGGVAPAKLTCIVSIYQG